MRFARASDRATVEAIVNDPLLRVWNSFDGAPLCDARKYLTEPSFVILGEEGCFLAKNLDPGRYVIHTNLLPHCRGQQAEEASREALAMAFLQTDSVELLTMIPVIYPHAKIMARRSGFRYLFDRKAIWPAQGEVHGVDFYGLTISDWISAGHCMEAGKEFHQTLHDQAVLKVHKDDSIHDAFVGAVVEMIRAGRPKKAVDVYNQWARLALYEEIKLESLDPLRINIKQAILRIEGDTFAVEDHHA